MLGASIIYKLCCAFYRSIALALALAKGIATIEATEATASVKVSALA